jgi:two-component system chemotaxis response regulator CheY
MSHKILLVEDAEDTRAVFRLGLELEGFQVVEAADGLEMISILQIEEVSAMVVDISMPRIDGISAIRTVKAMPRHRNAVVIVVTALLDPDVQARAYEAGAVEVLSKPIAPPRIVETLRKYLA